MKKKPTKKPKRRDSFEDTADAIANLDQRVADLEREMAAQLAIRDAVALLYKAQAEAAYQQKVVEQASARVHRGVVDDYDRRHPLSGMGAWTHPSGDSITLTGNTGTR